jgi:RecT family
MTTTNGTTAAPTTTMQPATPQPQAQLAVRQATPLVPTTLSDAIELAKMLAKSDIIPREYQDAPGNVLSAIMMGNDLGISPMQAMREIYVVEGRPASSALLKVALVKQSPLCESWELIESTDTQATFETKRKGSKSPTRHTYTLKDAETAGLYPGKESSNWRKRHKLMLRRRCESELADEVYPDVVKGLRTEDEADEIRERIVTGTHVAIDHSQVSAPPPPPVQTSGAASGAPDEAEVLFAELAQCSRREDIDKIRERGLKIFVKGHARRNEFGEALNARKRALGI